MAAGEAIGCMLNNKEALTVLKVTHEAVLGIKVQDSSVQLFEM